MTKVTLSFEFDMDDDDNQDYLIQLNAKELYDALERIDSLLRQFENTDSDLYNETLFDKIYYVLEECGFYKIKHV